MNNTLGQDPVSRCNAPPSLETLAASQRGKILLTGHLVIGLVGNESCDPNWQNPVICGESLVFCGVKLPIYASGLKSFVASLRADVVSFSVPFPLYPTP